jgi:putative tricarboxylic transport membrane protein
MSQKTRHNATDLISGFFFSGLGLSLCILSVTKFSVWKNGEPQEGFFPLVIAIIIIGLSLLIIHQSVFSPDYKKEETLNQKKDGKTRISRVMSYVISSLLYGILLESIGFLISSALLLVFIIKVVEKRSWKVTIILASAAVLISYILFAYFLGVPLPKGLINA